MPTITMNPAVRVRSPNYDRLLVGKKLTDARIRFYQERGRYGPEYKQQQKERVAKKAPRTTLAKLMKEFA